MEEEGHPFPENWQSKLNLLLGAGRQRSSFDVNVWVAAVMETILQVWSRSYSTTKIKAKKEQLKTENRKNLLDLGKERQETLA